MDWQRSTSGVHQVAHYYRTGANREVDFLVCADRIPFESKYTESVDRRDAQVMEQTFGRGVVARRRTLQLEGKTALIPTALVLATLANCLPRQPVALNQ